MNKGKRVKIQLTDGTVLVAIVQYWSGDNITVKGSDGFIYDVERNITNDDGAFIVL